MDADDYGFPIDGTAYRMVRARSGGSAVPHWYIAHVRDLDEHLHVLGEATDPRSPYPPEPYLETARIWVAETESIRPPPDRPPA
jgi:hypothetical protein